jgi:hypothetical protein
MLLTIKVKSLLIQTKCIKQPHCVYVSTYVLLKICKITHIMPQESIWYNDVHNNTKIQNVFLSNIIKCYEPKHLSVHSGWLQAGLDAVHCRHAHVQTSSAVH